MYAASANAKDSISQIHSILPPGSVDQADYAPTIVRVPPELLTQIFSYMALGVGAQDDRRWLSFSQVCVRWRRVSLTCPALWTQPDFANPPMVKTMLDRSAQLPLDLFMGETMSLRDQRVKCLAINTALGEWSRIRTLQMVVEGNVFAAVVRDNLFRSKGIIEFFEIRLHGEDREHVYFPASFLSYSSGLRIVRLKDGNILWPSLRTLNLTELTLTASFPTNPPPDWSEVFSAIRGMHSLQILHLAVTLSKEATDTSHLEPVRFPELTHLQLSTFWQGIRTILRQVSFPAQCKVTLAPEDLGRFGGGVSDPNYELCREIISGYTDARAPTCGDRIPMTCLTLRYHEIQKGMDGMAELTMTLSAGQDDTPLFTLEVYDAYEINDLAEDPVYAGWLKRLETLHIDGSFHQLTSRTC